MPGGEFTLKGGIDHPSKMGSCKRTRKGVMGWMSRSFEATLPQENTGTRAWPREEPSKQSPERRGDHVVEGRPNTVSPCSHLYSTSSSSALPLPLVLETKRADRAFMNTVLDKMCLTHRPSHAFKVLGSYERGKKGVISHLDFRVAVEQLNYGLNELEKGRIISTLEDLLLDPNDTGLVDIRAFVNKFEEQQPLGGSRTGLRAGDEAPPNRHQRPAALGSAGLGMGSDLSVAGSRERLRQDKFLFSMIRNKLAQHAKQLRANFRGMDPRKTQSIGRDAFGKAVEQLQCTTLAKEHIDRLFEISDKEGTGIVNYEDFLGTFELPDVLSQKLVPLSGAGISSTGGRQSLAETMEINPGDLTSALRNPLVHALRDKISGKAGAAKRIFKIYDVNGDGHLSFDEVVQCCQTLVPGLGKRDVAALVVRADNNGDGYLDYHEFLRNVVEGSAHPRMPEEDHIPKLTSETQTWGIFGPPTEPQTSPSASGKGPLEVSVDLPGVENGGLSPSLSPSPWGPRSTTAPSPSALRNSSSSQGSSGAPTTVKDILHGRAVAPALDSLFNGNDYWTLTNPLKDAGDRLQIPLSQSLDMSCLSRPGGKSGGGGEDISYSMAYPTGPLSPPSIKSSRATRFWQLRFPDTRHITTPEPGTSSFAADTFVRKSNPNFTSFQAADAAKKVQHALKARERFGWAAAQEAAIVGSVHG